MTPEHMKWVDSWMAIRAKLEAGTMTLDQAIRLVHEKRFRNTLGKKRQRAKEHVSGKPPANQTSFDTTLVAEECGRFEDLSPLAKQVADGVEHMVKEAHYDYERFDEHTDGVAYVILRIKSLYPLPPVQV